MFDMLDKHDAIGWDVDGTLINSHASESIRKFIFNNPQKRHCIVTFRTHDLLNRLEKDLVIAGYRDISVFDKVFSVPQNLWLEWALVQEKRFKNKISGKLTLAETSYIEWKGFICRQEGLSVLVDDDIKNTKRGCDRFKVILLDVMDLR